MVPISNTNDYEQNISEIKTMYLDMIRTKYPLSFAFFMPRKSEKEQGQSWMIKLRPLQSQKTYTIGIGNQRLECVVKGVQRFENALVQTLQQ